MKIPEKFSTRLSFAFLLFVTACISEDREMQRSVSVYAVGTVDDRAVYWKDGVMMPLATPGTVSSAAGSIVVSGDEVYVSGTVDNQSVYWKDGVLVALPEVDHQDYLMISTPAVSVSGSDVYIASMACPPYDYCRATLWKNGAPASIDAQYGGRISSMALSESNDVYVASSGYPALLWKNGEVQKISNDNSGASSYFVFVDREDVYVAGTVTLDNISVSCYWKNGERIDLSGGGAPAVAKSIFASGDDVYVVGNRAVGRGTRATLWKNGVPLELATEKDYSAATSVWASGNDVYVGGFEFDDSQFSFARYWKNGVSVALTDKPAEGYVTSIVVK